MNTKKILASKVMGVSKKKVRFSADALEDIKKAITRSDIRGLIAVGKITQVAANQKSRSGPRRKAAQKKKGRRKGRGSKKGSKYSIVSRKRQWLSQVRVQRNFLKELKYKQLITPETYRFLYARSKGGFFRNKRHIKLYLTEHNLVGKVKPK